MVKKICISPDCRMSVAVWGLAQEKKVFSLQESISEALDNNWSLKATGERIGRAVDVKQQARAEFLPKLGMTYGYTRLSEPNIMRVPIPGLEGLDLSTQDNYQWKGTVSQPVFTGFA